MKDPSVKGFCVQGTHIHLYPKFSTFKTLLLGASKSGPVILKGPGEAMGVGECAESILL